MILWQSGLLRIGISYFGHNKSFLYEPRSFASVEEHDEEIIRRHNSIVSPDDVVYHLGDEMVGCDYEYGADCINQLNGQLYLVIGNHTTDNRIAYIKEHCPNVEDIQFAYRLRHHKFHFFLSHYPTITSNYDDGKKLYQHTISLCGHSHCQNCFKDWNKGFIYHCELDAHKNMPIEINKIVEDLKSFFTLSIEEQKQIISMEKYNA